MTTTETSGLLRRKTGASYWDLEIVAVTELSLFLYASVAPAYGCVFLFTIGFGIMFFSSFVIFNLLFPNGETNV